MSQERAQGRHARLPYGRAHGQVMVEDLIMMPFGRLTIIGRIINDTLHEKGLVATPVSHRSDHGLAR
ncbi:hypothetical protein SEA_ORLA_62 [Gordonia phage Orla]|nr:hypothetical protein SEA_ORLA_62 [Gordonia phage Orla]